VNVSSYADLRDKSVLVTGGATGIGASMVAAFARQGSRVAFVDIAADAAQSLAARLRIEGHQVDYLEVDITDTGALRNAIAELKKLTGAFDVLVNNAANDERHSFASITPEYFDRQLAVNLKHALFAAQAVLPDMVAKCSGSIVNFSSISWMAGSGGMAVYTAAKSAMLGLTRSIARDYGEHNIRVNAIAPGWIKTERQEALWITPDGERQMFQAQCLKRWLIPEEVAQMALFLASDAASACTAQHFIVDGGWV
jgi:D-xylose 1-dehydrogenase